jgi:protein-S-isoprenylcysteine O-methyltransferase Ste14
MMTTQQLNLVSLVSLVVCWGVFVLVWLAGAIYYQSRAPAERTRSWVGSTLPIGVVVIIVVAIAVPRADWASVGPHQAWIRLLGLVILLAGTGFTVWARLALGAMWSGAPAVKQEHQLRTTGPYAVTRHPIYTGLLGMMLGSGLLAGGRWIVVFPVFLVLFELKIHIEERFMTAEFPDEYPRYRQRVPQLVPGLRRPGRRRVASG